MSIVTIGYNELINHITTDNVVKRFNTKVILTNNIKFNYHGNN